MFVISCSFLPFPTSREDVDDLKLRWNGIYHRKSLDIITYTKQKLAKGFLGPIVPKYFYVENDKLIIKQNLYGKNKYCNRWCKTKDNNCSCAGEKLSMIISSRYQKTYPNVSKKRDEITIKLNVEECNRLGNILPYHRGNSPDPVFIGNPETDGTAFDNFWCYKIH